MRNALSCKNHIPGEKRSNFYICTRSDWEWWPPTPPYALRSAWVFLWLLKWVQICVFFLSFWCFMIFEANASDWTWHQADAQGRKAGGVIRGYLAASFEINTQMIFNWSSYHWCWWSSLTEGMMLMMLMMLMNRKASEWSERYLAASFEINQWHSTDTRMTWIKERAYVLVRKNNFWSSIHFDILDWAMKICWKSFYIFRETAFEF